jgi:hypothetical protein
MRPTSQQAFTRMSENEGSNVGYGSGEVDRKVTFWAVDETEGSETVVRVEVCGTIDGTEGWREMNASCCEIWASIAADCCW